MADGISPTVDPGVQNSILTGMSRSEAAAVDTRIRAWDTLNTGAGAMWQLSLASPTVLAAQGIRMLNGTPTMAPGNATNANT